MSLPSSGFHSLSSSEIIEHDQQHANAEDREQKEKQRSPAATGQDDGNDVASQVSSILSDDDGSSSTSSPPSRSTSRSSQHSHSRSPLHMALHRAQTRAREAEGVVSFVYEHVETRVKEAVRGVTKAKKIVIEVEQEEKNRVEAETMTEQQQQAEMKIGSNEAQGTSGEGAGASLRSSSDSSSSTAPNALHSLPSLASSSFSPHRAAYLSALSSPLMRPLSSSPPPLAAAAFALGDAALQGVVERKEMSSSDSIVMSDGSFCLLPYDHNVIGSSESPAPPPAMRHSSSQQAMLEAHEAMEELVGSGREEEEDTTTSASNASSLQTSPFPDDERSQLHSFPSSLPALSVLAAASPSSSAQRRVLDIVSTASSPVMQPQPSAVQLEEAAPAAINISPSPLAVAPTPASDSTPSAALVSAQQNLKEAQARFSTLAQFCAPLILRSPALLRLKEEAELQQQLNRQHESENGDTESEGLGMPLSDEELSRSVELTLDDIAAHQALEGSSNGSPTTSSMTATAQEQIESASEERKYETTSSLAGDPDSSLVIVPSPSSIEEENEEHKGEHKEELRQQPQPLSQQEQRKSKEAEKEAMRIYIKKLRADVLEEEKEEKQSGSAAQPTSSSSSSTLTSAVTLDEALEGCVLLHQMLCSDRSRLDVLDQRSGSGEESADLLACRDRIAHLRALNASLKAQRSSSRATAVSATEELDSLRRTHSEVVLKMRNMERILQLLDIPLNEKGEARDESKLPKKGSNFWTLTALTVLFGSILAASAYHWRAAQDAMPSILSKLGIRSSTATAAAAGATAATAAAAAAATMAAADMAAQSAAATAGVSAAASEVARTIVMDASTNTPSFVPRLFQARFIHGVGPQLVNVSRLACLHNLISNISLQLVQIA